MIQERLDRLNTNGLSAEVVLSNAYSYASSLFAKMNEAVSTGRLDILREKGLWKTLGRLVLSEILEPEPRQPELIGSLINIATIIEGFESVDRIYGLESFFQAKMPAVQQNVTKARVAAYKTQHVAESRFAIAKLIEKYSPPDSGDRYIVAVEYLLAKISPSTDNGSRSTQAPPQIEQ